MLYLEAFLAEPEAVLAVAKLQKMIQAQADAEAIAQDAVALGAAGLGWLGAVLQPQAMSIL